MASFNYSASSKDGKVQSGVIETFASLQEASTKLGISRPNISKCCLGERMKCGGFRWRYV
jgi:hypothetical protein